MSSFHLFFWCGQVAVRVCQASILQVSACLHCRWVTEDSLEKALENCAPELFEDLRKYVKPDQRRDFKTWYSTDQTE